MDEAEKKEKLRQKIEFQVACEEKAFRIVERLIDNPVERQWFLDALHFITPNHYNDVVEERAVAKLCGYPLCPKPLGKIPTQKYFISTKTNRVYDIEARKNFCSACCYKASQYIEKQISTNPIWSRKTEPRKVFDLLPLNKKTGKVGEEVQISTIDDMRSEVKKLERLDHYQQSLEQMGQRNRNTGDQTKQEVDKRNQSQGSLGNDTEQAADYTDDCVYSLDKAMSEMGIGDRDSSKECAANKTGKREDSSNSLEKSIKVQCVKENIMEKASASKGIESVAKDNVCVNNKVNESIDSVAFKVKQDTESEEIKTEILKKEKKKSKSRKSEQQSKTDYLMKLLDKRKDLLSQMADIQHSEKDGDSQTGEIRNQNRKSHNGSTDTGANSNLVEDKSSQKKVAGANSGGKSKELAENVKDSDSAKDCVAKDNEGKIMTEMPGDLEGTESLEIGGHIIEEVASHEGDKDSVKLKDEINEERTSESRAKNSVKLTKSVSQSSLSLKLTALGVIHRSLKSWITKETIEYLRKEEVPRERNVGKGKFEKQYRALVAKVDAQERDFSQLLGEENVDDDSDNQPRAPAPHFDVLKEEMTRNQLRVREFMKGSFTYKEQKIETPKAETDKVQIVLPTVDKYDQMVIRQRIVLDRINKVLPELMNPLHLPVGDVFTDIRQITETFHLTSENIMFHPAEWNLVTILILKMLSRKLPRLSTEFVSPSAVMYIQTLLSGIQTDIQTLDKHVDDLCNM